MRLLLGVSGGIAAYRACELLSLARKRGHEVRVLMTANAARFVGPLSFEALSGTPPLVGDGHLAQGNALAHIEWAKWAEVVCVAPATANTLTKIALGIGDDALSTVLLALPRGRPVVLAPAMNTEMWANPINQRNLRWLRELGDRFQIVAPVEKRLACGDVGPGGLAEPSEILLACEAAQAAAVALPHTGV